MVTDEDKKDRNKKFLKLFTDLKFPVRLIGNLDSPCIIYKDAYILSCHVKNYNVIFTSKSHDGIMLATYRLENQMNLTKEQVQKLLDAADHRKCWKIKLENTNVFISGWNFVDREVKDKSTMYPVFSKYNPKIYFDKKYAESIIELHQDYSLVVV